MCTPYLDDLKSRILKVNESIRSTRFKCVEVTRDGLIDQHREPILFTADQLTQQVLGLFDEINNVTLESSLWNSTTSLDVIKLFQIETSACRTDLLAVFQEAIAMRKEVSELGTSIEEYAPQPKFDLFRSLIENGDYSLWNPPQTKRAAELFQEYQDSPAVRESVLNEIEQLRPGFIARNN